MVAAFMQYKGGGTMSQFACEHDDVETTHEYSKRGSDALSTGATGGCIL
jgi:hypothetical protein